MTAERRGIAFWAKTLSVSKPTVLARLRKLEAVLDRKVLWKKSTPKRTEYAAAERDVLAAFPEHAEALQDDSKLSAIKEELAEHRMTIAALLRSVAALGEREPSANGSVVKFRKIR